MKEQPNTFIRLINYIRDLGWGEITVIVKDGEPVMIKRSEKDIKLTGDVTGL